MNESEQTMKDVHFLMRVLERNVKRRVIQPIVQISSDFIAFCLLFPDCLRMVSIDRRQALLKDRFCAASNLQASKMMAKACEQLIEEGSASFLRWKASWIISFFTFFSSISYCSSLIILSFSSTFEICTPSSLPSSRPAFSGLCREFMRVAILTRLPLKAEVVLVSDSPLRDSGMRQRWG